MKRTQKSKFSLVIVFVMSFVLMSVLISGANADTPALATPDTSVATDSVDYLVVLTDEDYSRTNDISVMIIIAMCIVLLATLFFTAEAIIQIVKQKRKFERQGIKGFFRFLIFLVFEASIYAAIYFFPDVFLNGLRWTEIKLVYPASFMLMILSLAVVVFLYFAYLLIIRFFTKKDDKPYYSLITLSIVSGIAYAFMMFLINQVVSDESAMKIGVAYYFLIALLLYVFCSRIMRALLAVMANNMVFNKRLDLMNKILRTPFHRIEKYGNEKIYACLNNDTEVISEAISIITVGVTSGVAILCCFIYLGISSLYGLLAAFVFVVIGAGVLMLVSRNAERYYESGRDIQNSFFKFIHDMVEGFKELSINYKRRNDFNADMGNSCEEYRKVRIKAAMVGANVNFAGELLALFILGGMAFLFPLVFTDVRNETLRDFVFLFLFMKGPIDNVMNLIPRISMVKVSWKRINEILDEISELEDKSEAASISPEEKITLQLKDVTFQYKNGEDAGETSFGIGPINSTFEPGEIVFITGGNGSGKSTLAKIITGLYVPDSGEIAINGSKVDAIAKGQYMSVIYSDYFLFKKLYGIEYLEKEGVIQDYLNTLRIQDKLTISNGELSTISLSSGQKKRVALLISYLEDKQVYLFDEWAADQDPEFRRFFYYTLLPEMKARGKCVIAITHDDRYFNVADKIIKMESGQVIEEKAVEMFSV